MIVNEFDAMTRMHADVEDEIQELLNVGHGMKLREEENLEEGVVEKQIGLSDEQTKTTQMNALQLGMLMKTAKLLKL